MRPNRIASLVLALAPLALAASASAQAFDECGTIVAGVECDRLFQDSAGTNWLLEDFGNTQVGDTVRVVGTADPSCISFCFVPCVLGNTIGPCADPTASYCECGGSGACVNPDPSAGCANSTGAGARLSGGGSTSVSADDLSLFAEHLPPNQSAIFYMGAGQTSAPFGDGFRCVAAGGVGVFRFGVQNAGPAGTIARTGIVGTTHASFPPAGRIQAGDTWYFQCWYRDPTGPCGSTFNLSNAAAASFGA